MKKAFFLFCFNTFLLSGFSQDGGSNRNISFDARWRFIKDSTITASDPKFEDSKWRIVDLPHDWSIEDLPSQIPDSVNGPFHKGSVGGLATGFTVGGISWYRKKFISEKKFTHRLVSVHFDGVYMNSDVWLNGHHLGNHPYGYTPFYYDLSPYLSPEGQENVMAVRVSNEGKNSRWYSGSGIYRHVWLTVTHSVHVAPKGVDVATAEVSSAKATLRIKTNVINESSSRQMVSLINTIISPDGKLVGTSRENIELNAGSKRQLHQEILLAHPRLWSVEDPDIYQVVVEIQHGTELLDRYGTCFGVRTIKVDAKNGLTVNGQRVLLKGGCIHHDDGPLGSAIIDRAEVRKIELLKKNGFNAIRTCHNPPSTQLLDACDRLGMMVIDEAFDAWEQGKNDQDYHRYFDTSWKKDIDAMVLRDRNHPSVIMWSIGNEIPERADSSGLRIGKSLCDEIRRLDSTRPITEAINSFWDRPKYKWDTSASAFALLDVGGYNYQWQEYEKDHIKFPNRVMAGTESFPKEAFQNWSLVENHPYIIGDFVWTAMDYLGEASIGHAVTASNPKFTFLLDWPWYDSFCGDIDLIGNKKPQSYYRDVVWRRNPIALAVHTPVADNMNELVSPWGWPDEQQSWTWPGNEGRYLEVRVFSRASLIRLLLNGKEIGEQKIDGSAGIVAAFKVPYQPGLLKAVNIEDGKETDSVELKTTEKPKHLRLVPDRANIHASRNDLSYVMVEITDENGQIVPYAEIPVKFTISGVGEIAGVGNGNPTDMASLQNPVRKSWRGKCLVIVRPNGEIGKTTLKATATGLTSAQIEIESR